METVQSRPGSPDWLEVFTADERPDLWKSAEDDRLFDHVWPEYNLHGNNSEYLEVLVPRFADLQAFFTDRSTSGEAAYEAPRTSANWRVSTNC